MTTDTNPHDNNEEGNGLTGTSGGEYFVDEPSYIHLQSAPLPAGTTDVRFRYSTDAAYVDTGFFVDDVTVGGQAATLSSAPGNWLAHHRHPERTTGWCRCLSPCDLTPGSTRRTRSSTTRATTSTGSRATRCSERAGFTTSCLKATKDAFTVVISNLPTGDIQVLDADYRFRLTGSSKP